MKLIEKFI